LRSLITSSNLILFFSLPFKPVGTFNPFFNGHIGVSIEGTLYHVVNPYLLKSGFLFSVMPLESWLFGCGGAWVERNAASPYYKHVYLYRKNETTRTVVYGAGITVATGTIMSIQKMFAEDEENFRNGTKKYSLLSNNCSSIIARAFTRTGLLASGVQNRVPSLFFKRFIAMNGSRVVVRSIGEYDRKRFSVRQFCLGLWSRNPRDCMDKIIETTLS